MKFLYYEIILVDTLGPSDPNYYLRILRAPDVRLTIWNENTHMKVATTFVVGQPRTKLVSCDLFVSATSSMCPAVNQSSLIFTDCLSLKFPLIRAFAMSRRSEKRNKCLSCDCMPCRKILKIRVQLTLNWWWRFLAHY